MKNYLVVFHFEGLGKQEVQISAESPVIALIRASALCDALCEYDPTVARIVTIGEIKK